MEQTKDLVFWGVLAGALVYDSLLVFSIARPRLRFWPLPPRPSWRHEFMRVVGIVGPLSVLGMLAFGWLDWDSFAWRHSSRFAVGGLLFAGGGAFALWGFFGLGVTASQGLGGPLIARGAYRFSRNPSTWARSKMEAAVGRRR